MPKVVAIVQARSTSTRLPNKGLLDLGGKTVIERVINRIKAVNLLEPLIDEIVVATPEKDPIKDWCQSHKISYFEGSHMDVLDRFYRCAKKHKANWILRITGDCPLIEPVAIYRLLKVKIRIDYQALAFNQQRIPGGWDCELFSFEILKRAHKQSKDREHVSSYMRHELEDFYDIGITAEVGFFNGISFELNTKEDYRRLKKYVELL